MATTQQRFGVTPTNITFTDADAHGIHHPHADALVIQAVIGNPTVCRILVDEGSSIDILYRGAFTKMGFGVNNLRTGVEPLFGFSRESTVSMGVINLPITVGTTPHESIVQSSWTVVDSPSPYNALIGRPTLVSLRAATSIYHLCMKFPTPNGVDKVRGGQYEAKTCYADSLRIGENYPNQREK